MKQHIAHVQSMALAGIDCIPIDVEVHTGPGIPSIVMVGLPDAAVSEARDRVRSAFINSGLTFPRKRVTMNLAPAHVKKSGSHYDVPLAIGLLHAEGVVKLPEDIVCIGELALDGSMRPIAGALIMAHAALLQGKRIIAPAANAPELSLLQSEDILLADSLGQIVKFLQQGDRSRLATVLGFTKDNLPTLQAPATHKIVMEDIIGQQQAKRGAFIAACGGHNMLLAGPPGTGKTMLARAFESVLPPLTHNEMIETTKIHSVLQPGMAAIHTRPFRAPHHVSSAVAVIGGGAQLRPGELSLAHNGVLFLDEFPEFRRDAIEALREPLESGEICITRASGSVRYPCRAIVIAAYNPCPCGFGGGRSIGKNTAQQQCSCSPQAIDRYRRKLSGPILDRFDIKLVMDSIGAAAFTHPQKENNEWTTAVLAKKVARARSRQLKRQSVLNTQLTAPEIEMYFEIQGDARSLLHTAVDSGALSLRGYTKALRIAATIADVENSAVITQKVILEALAFTQRQQ